MADQAKPYLYPTPAMLGDTRAANMRAGGAPIQAGNLVDPGLMTAQNGPPMVAGPTNWRQRLAVWILGADGGRVLFGPQQPLQPQAQAPDYQVVTRPWDYPVGFNTRVLPRTGEPISFAQLKNLADGYDVLRIIIERVKDKIVTQPVTVMPKKKEQQRDARCDEVEDFLAFPDKTNSWGDWLRMLLEQTFVYDAACVYLWPDMAGDLYAMQVEDGSLFAPKIMGDGRLPPPELGPAYQKVIKGLPAVDYVQPVPKGRPVPLDPEGNPYPELFYKRKNPRVHSVYGFSTVEQIIATVTIALNRESYLASYYLNGSLPDTVFTTPANWSSQQIANFQANFNAVLAGNLATRRQVQFVPDGSKPWDMKEKALTDEVDQWLVKIICFAFGISPIPFVKAMNKGQEKTHHEEAIQEGLEPWQKFIIDFVNQIIAIKFGYRDLTLRFTEDDPVDPVDQAAIDSSDIQAGIYHPDEIRAKRGDPPMSPEMRAEMAMANFRNAPNATLLTPDQQAEEDARSQAKAEAAAALKPQPAPAVAGSMGKGLRGKFGRSTPGGVPY